MSKPKFFRGKPIIQPGETYEIEGVSYEVITSTTQIVGVVANDLVLMEPEFWLENLETNERIYIKEKELQAKFTEQ
ncbi:hypothetical protein M670_00146 [Schinkia azotoformans MEV2011]|uniref:Uncharacterized protein n=1 Tax=Schinkia azotoformans MEV2011 TaxID=1348973 RepID=A0A072P3V3_SCHAZ|nr:hypothetical protein [Schinkia azotoformans]KEF40130.1 hypothetical protein M670_00146 [Schinkia azotoformans MEV2011]MEC1714735.1 hypothetical protein [Schinkia azotoformans]MEC1757509.1 hypothetical protein [Schinkia azotoformans]